MKYGIKVIECTGILIRGPKPTSGSWLVSCDVDAHGGYGEAECTTDARRAKAFESRADAIVYWRRESTKRPLRKDGRPNRPLTVATVEIAPLPVQ